MTRLPLRGMHCDSQNFGMTYVGPSWRNWGVSFISYVLFVIVFVFCLVLMDRNWSLLDRSPSAPLQQAGADLCLWENEADNISHPNAFWHGIPQQTAGFRRVTNYLARKAQWKVLQSLTSWLWIGYLSESIRRVWIDCLRTAWFVKRGGSACRLQAALPTRQPSSMAWWYGGKIAQLQLRDGMAGLVGGAKNSSQISQTYSKNKRKQNEVGWWLMNKFFPQPKRHGWGANKKSTCQIKYHKK